MAVEHQFKAAWRHSTDCPPVREIFKIQMSDAIIARYERYRLVVWSIAERAQNGNSLKTAWLELLLRIRVDSFVRTWPRATRDVDGMVQTEHVSLGIWEEHSRAYPRPALCVRSSLDHLRSNYLGRRLGGEGTFTIKQIHIP